MKSIKTKLSLSALALACCLSAGVMSLQATTADDVSEISNAGFTMANGASVYLGTDEEYSGIRWTTNVSQAFYDQISDKNPQFGVIVAPTVALNGQDLTHANAETLGVEVATIAEGRVDASETAQTYYSAIDYNDIVKQSGVTDETQQKELLQQAYAMELTARAYVKVGEEYVYANLNGVNTSRSARQVAIAAELAGEIDKKYREKDKLVEAAKGVEYYGKEDKYVPSEKSTGAAGTAYVNLEAPDTDVAVADFAISGTIEEVLIGAERVSYTTYAENTLTIDEAFNIPTGEHYVTVFTTAGDIYTKPIIGATKVLKVADDLKMFNAKGDKYNYTTKVSDSNSLDKEGNFDKKYWKPEQEQGGYYVLGQNIEAEGYVHGSLNVADEDKAITAGYNNSTWNTASAYKNKPIGLTGTFNGLGYAIKDMEIGSQREGFFGIVNGGTVKNVAFTDVKAEGERKYVVANILLSATIENVYIRTDKYEEGVSKGFPLVGSAALADFATGSTILRSCVIEYQASADDAIGSIGNITPSGIFFTTYNKSFSCEGVYCVSGNTLKDFTHALVYTAADTTTVNVALAENDVIKDDETKVTKENGETIYVHSAAKRPRAVVEGVYRYMSLDNLAAANHDYSLSGNCWTVVDGVPVFGYVEKNER
jgi:hypothetical protein